MSTIKTSTGLVSGIDTGALIDALINAERAPARRLESRLKNVQATQTGLGQLQAQLLSLSTSVQTISDSKTFKNLAVVNSAPTQLTVTAKSVSLPGSYQFQSVRLASTHRAISRGFANADTQQIGTAAKLVISRENSLSQPVRLELLNDAQGVRRGTIRLTDRSGATADVDLRKAVTVDDVVAAINNAGLGIEASTINERFVLRDTTGQSAANLSVVDIGGGSAAADLGIAQSVAGATLTGSDVLQVTEDFTFSLLNDGNGLRNISGKSDLSFALADGTNIQVDLDGTATLGDVLRKVNDHADNAGKLAASLQNGRLVFTDTTSGAGVLTISNLNGSNAREVLGLNSATVGGVVTGQRLIGGANSVLLRNLNGGQGISTPGQVTLTDRTGETATIDLSAAETLDDVLNAINQAESAGSVKLQLKARLNSQGTGIEIVDSSGASASNLVIADVGGGTVAADLGIAVDSAVTSVNSGSLKRRSVNEATSLSTYSPKGTGVALGSFRITDSQGNQAVVTLTSNTKTIGDVIDLINNATGIQVTAQLNESGDGIALVDDAGGAGTLKVAEVGSRTAADLRLLGDGVVGAGGKQEIVSRRALIVDVEATDTLNSLTSKINSVGGTVRASIVNSGATVNGFRISLSSTITGQSGQFVIDDGGLNLGFATQDVGHDAVLRIGGDAQTGFLVSSTSNTFTNAFGFFDITLHSVGDVAANVNATLDKDKITNAIQSFVTAYNAYTDLSNALTKFDTATQTRSALQGVSTPITIQNRFSSLINAVTGSAANEIRSLADVGVRVTTGGKLSFDATRLSAALDAAPDQVQALFSDTTTGFGVRFDQALDGFNDQFTGTLTAQFNAMEANADELTERIADIDARLVIRRTRLELQFAQMETVLSGLQSQQTALNGLANILENLKSSD